MRSHLRHQEGILADREGVCVCAFFATKRVPRLFEKLCVRMFATEGDFKAV